MSSALIKPGTKVMAGEGAATAIAPSPEIAAPAMSLADTDLDRIGFPKLPLP